MSRKRQELYDKLAWSRLKTEELSTVHARHADDPPEPATAAEQGQGAGTAMGRAQSPQASPPRASSPPRAGSPPRPGSRQPAASNWLPPPPPPPPDLSHPRHLQGLVVLSPSELRSSRPTLRERTQRPATVDPAAAPTTGNVPPRTGWTALDMLTLMARPSTCPHDPPSVSSHPAASQQQQQGPGRHSLSPLPHASLPPALSQQQAAWPSPRSPGAGALLSPGPSSATDQAPPTRGRQASSRPSAPLGIPSSPGAGPPSPGRWANADAGAGGLRPGDTAYGYNLQTPTAYEAWVPKVCMSVRHGPSVLRQGCVWLYVELQQGCAGMYRRGLWGVQEGCRKRRRVVRNSGGVQGSVTSVGAGARQGLLYFTLWRCLLLTCAGPLPALKALSDASCPSNSPPHVDLCVHLLA